MLHRRAFSVLGGRISSFRCFSSACSAAAPKQRCDSRDTCSEASQCSSEPKPKGARIIHDPDADYAKAKATVASMKTHLATHPTKSSQSATSATGDLKTRFPVRNDWTREEVREIYGQPLIELMYMAATAHRAYFNPTEIQQCTLLSIKTGGCQEECSYCSQSSKAKSHVKPEQLLPTDQVIEAARKAKDAGSTRFCMGAAWRGPSTVGPRQFGRILEMIREIRDMKMEVCATLGFLNAEQAKQLKDAGLSVYNHNLNTSEEYHPSVVGTHTFQDRMNTLKIVQEAGMQVCCGGIIGLGEKHEDRVSLLHSLSTLPMHPESVPVNALVANEGTPLEGSEPVPVWEIARAIATARILMPKAMIRLSAGRATLSASEQALCFMSGANSVFTGEKLLTTPNACQEEDKILFDVLGLVGMPAKIEAHHAH